MTIAAYDASGKNLMGVCINVITNSSQTQLEEESEECQQEPEVCSVTDPIALGQQWLQLQKLRAKVKKKVDTKASKGRKTRFDIHAKLINFMAPTYPSSTIITEEAKNELFASLFKDQQFNRKQ